MIIRAPERITIEFLQNLYSSINDSDVQVLTFDWHNALTISPDAHCAILHLRDLLEEKASKITHENKNLAWKKFDEISRLRLEERPIEQDGVYISPVKTESRQDEDVKLLHRFLRSSILRLNLDFYSFKIIFAELYQNIC